ncbi:hypothetical protein Glove_535g5 [Diversispora epigaea]|uniref:Uncharacterized protein n=1 Tax=Diversispora epigaea TaxID=1348612 RepID=A0A397GLX5_9GLOM|nr:hypothetical protein Glove_535g5 [Diversispora epigaea]
MKFLIKLFPHEDQYYEYNVIDAIIDEKIKMRCVSGMIRNCGRLRYDSKELINRAYELYHISWTVSAHGFPSLTIGKGFEYLKFHDNNKCKENEKCKNSEKLDDKISNESFRWMIRRILCTGGLLSEESIEEEESLELGKNSGSASNATDDNGTKAKYREQNIKKIKEIKEICDEIDKKDNDGEIDKKDSDDDKIDKEGKEKISSTKLVRIK